MKQEFAQILQAHRARYPLMQPQDYGKLAYQNAYGAGHFAPEHTQVCKALLREWETVCAPCPPEPIGNGLCRFHLTNAYVPGEAAPLLAELFCRTARAHRASPLADHLAALEALDVPGMARWLAAYRAQGCPPVRHSQSFREAYAPHYRLLKTEYAGFFPALLQISALAACGKPKTVAIDGRCGSGKTRLAALIAQLFPCNVLHMDDFYLPLERRDENWTAIPGGNMDFARFQSAAMNPARAGHSVAYRAYDCQHGVLREAVSLPARTLTIIEGSYAHHPVLKDQYDLRIFLTCDEETQARRLAAREGAYYPVFTTRWIPLEEQYFTQCRVAAGSALVIDTTAFDT